mgnify:FL=1
MAIESQGTKLEISGTSGEAVTVTELTVGYPTILGATAHSLAEGDIVTLSNFAGDDAKTLNSKVVVVRFVTDDTFAVGIDTTGKTITDNTDQALATPLEWTEIGEVVSFDGPSGTASVIDVSHLGSTAKEKLIGLPDEGQITLSVNWDLENDTGQQAAMDARAARKEKNFKLTFSDASTATFAGYVLGMSVSGGVDGKVEGSITIEITDDITWSYEGA